MTDKVCIIGAGASGITAAKALHERGIPYDWFEMGPAIGGVWRYDNDTGRSAAYKSLHINTSKDRMAYSDFPFPDDYPDYPHHSQILAYFEGYVDHFGLRETITFNTCVEHVAPQPQAGYLVTLQGGEQHEYQAVLVCNGHHWDARMPEPPFPGTFNGQTLHSIAYREPFDYRDQHVLVVGIGNSGVDIACDLANAAKKVYLATRSGAHVIPKYILGMPTDWLVHPTVTRLPFVIQRWLMQLTVWIGRGPQSRYGIPTPDMPILHQHPTVSSDLLHYAGHGKVAIKPNVKELQGNHVLFDDDRRVAIDKIIYATGYKISFPFLDNSIVNHEYDDIALYNLVVHPEYNSLYFIGLCQPLGAIMPIAERQALWVADLIEEIATLPDKPKMYQEINQRRTKTLRRYAHRPRHTIQVDFYPYMRALQRARKHGRKRVL